MNLRLDRSESNVTILSRTTPTRISKTCQTDGQWIPTVGSLNPDMLYRPARAEAPRTPLYGGWKG